MSFDGTSSSGSPTDYVWDFGDGEFAYGNAQVTHVYEDPGTYLVVLRVINLAGDDTSSMTIEITAPSGTPAPTPTPTGTPTPTPTPSPTPETCVFPPNVIGMSPSAAESALSGAGWTYVIHGDLTTGHEEQDPGRRTRTTTTAR